MTIVCNGCTSQPTRSNESESPSLPQDANSAEEVKLSGRDLRLIPEHVRNNMRLKILDISCNALGHAGDEVFGDCVGLRGLTRLNLSANELKDVPSNLTDCGFLEVLCLTGNELEEIPDGIVSLHRLKRLHADFNYINHLPRDWSSLCSLTKLTLSNNRLEDIPATIWTLQSLQVLNLQRNRISNVGPFPEEAASHLRELRLSRNQLSGCLDLSQLVNLSLLDVSYNDLEDIEVTRLFNLEPRLRRL